MRQLTTITVMSLLMACLSHAEPDSLSWKTKHDERGRVVQTISPDGKATAFSYATIEDGRERVITKRPPAGPKVAWRYDDQGRLIAMTDGEGQVAYRYDDHGRLAAVEREGVPAVEYTYDLMGRLRELRVGDLYRVAWAYDFLGRVSTYETPAGTIHYEYLRGQNTVVRSLPNGVKTFWRYQPNGRLEQIIHGRLESPDARQYSLLARYTYQYYAGGRIAAIKEESPSGTVVKQYAYDPMGRLVRATGAGGKRYAYEYDQLGNRTRATETGRPDQVCTYDWAGRLTTVNDQPCTYDANGNLTHLTLDGTPRTYAYHPDNRLATAKIADTTVRYRYDGFGKLVAREAGDRTTRFIPNPLSSYWQPLVIEPDDKTAELVLWGSTGPIAIVSGERTSWLLQDHLGSTRLMSDKKGQSVKSIDYSPFGVSEGADIRDAIVPRFAGLFYDSNSKAGMTQARVYAAALGRFTQPDRVEILSYLERFDCGLYAYCFSDPANFVDPEGTWPRKPDQTPQNPHVSPAGPDTSAGPVPSPGVNSGLRPGPVGYATPPGIYFQRMDDGTHREWVINTLKQYEATALKNWHLQNGNREPSLQDLQDIRKISVSQFAKNFAQYPLHEPISKSDYYMHVANMSIATDLGPVSLDWLTSLASMGEQIGPVEGITSRMTPTSRYGVVKRIWNIIKPWAGGPKPDPADPFPARDLNAVKILEKRLYNPKIPFENVFQRPSPLREKVDDLSRHMMDYIDRMNKNRGDYDISGGNGRTAGPGGFASEGAVAFSNLMANRPPHWRPPGNSGNPPGPQPPLKPPKPSGPEYPWPGEGPDWGPAPGGVIPPDPTGPGGQGLPPGPDFPTPPPPSHRSSLSPSNVGGVYLGGAGQVLAGIGTLQGVRVDTNGNLVLIADDGKEQHLPPLQLDDLVTVFRSVYLHGEGPTVTIDPNPKNPSNSAMIIRHGKATEQTYVGWVLYQADRLMKSYTQGADNITQRKVISNVPGYKEVVDTIYFGNTPGAVDADPLTRQKEGNWERFWIVPAAARRFQGDRRELTLLDVPLKVKTQKMKWVGNKLVDDEAGASSVGARTFTAWFTRNYGGIAAECYLPPPAETGLDSPVPVFAELQRIATLTAIAEKLRADGVPMPAWMHNYEVQPVPFESTTPGLRVTRKRTVGTETQTSQIFGGVELTPESDKVTTITAVADTATVVEQVKAEVDERVEAGELTEEEGKDLVARENAELGERLELAETLAPVVANKISPVAAEPLAPVPVTVNSRRLKAVPVPGAETKALAPARLVEDDLVVPLIAGRSIRLRRSFHSFFNPRGPWGQGWALNLPQLSEINVPVEKRGNTTRTSTAYDLLTPLNRVSARFNTVRKVSALDDMRLLTPDTQTPFYGLTKARPEFLRLDETWLVMLKDGREWHFDESGLLVAAKDGPTITVYNHYGDGRLAEIVGLYGGKRAGKISLEYDAHGRVLKAKGESYGTPGFEPVEVAYAYNEDGRLSRASFADGILAYSYKGPWVTEVTWLNDGEDAKSEVLRKIGYNRRGQVLRQTSPHGTRRIEISAAPDGIECKTTSESGDAPPSYARYDNQMRPVERVDSDGARHTWKRQANGEVKQTITLPNQRQFTITDSADGTARTISAENGTSLRVRYDEAGRVLQLAEGDQPIMTQAWRPDGQLAQRQIGRQVATPRYGDHGITSSILLHPPTDGNRVTEFQETKLDVAGRPIEVRDHTGLTMILQYDEANRLAGILQKTPKGPMGSRIERDVQGRIQRVTSSWGDVSCDYDEEGFLEQVRLDRADQQATIDYTAGQMTRSVAFDGGVTTIDYNDTGIPHTVTCPNGLALTYDYDKNQNLTSVDIGSSRRVRLQSNNQGDTFGYTWESVPAD